MKKFKVLMSLLCLCAVLAAPVSVMAAPAEDEVITVEASGHVTGTNVQLRNRNNIASVNGQVLKNDTYDIVSAQKVRYNNNDFILVRMTSGPWVNTTGYICVLYISRVS